MAVRAEPPERRCGHGRQLFTNPMVRDCDVRISPAGEDEIVDNG